MGIRTWISMFLVLESSKNQEWSLQISHYESRITNSDLSRSLLGKNQDIFRSFFEGKQDSRIKIQDFKRNNVKNQERMITVHSWKNGLFWPTLQIYALYVKRMFTIHTLPTVFFFGVMFFLIPKIAYVDQYLVKNIKIFK